VCVVGGFLATQGKISIGEIQAFVQYSSQFSQPVLQIANIANVIELAKGEVKFENVDFSYKSDEPLIKTLPDGYNTILNE